VTPSKPVQGKALEGDSGADLGTSQPDGAWPLSARIIVLLTLAAAALRLLRLDHQSLWVDELMTFQQIRPDRNLDFWEQIRQNVQGPLYLSVLWPLVRLHAGELMLRLPAALAGIAMVPALIWSASPIFRTRTLALGAWLLVISPFHIWYSQEARGYAFVMLFAVLTSGLLLRMLRDGPRLHTALTYALLAALGVWSNMSMCFLWAAHGLTMLALRRPRAARDWSLWVLAFGCPLVAIVPWVLQATNYWALDNIVPGAETGHALRGDTTFSPLALPFAGFTFFFGYSLGPSLRELHQPDQLAVLRAHAPLLGLSALVAGAALVAGLFRMRDRQRWLLVWIALPVLAVVVLAVRNVKPFNPRYLAVAWPWILLLTAQGLAGISRRRGGWLLAAALSALFLWSTCQYHFATRYHKADMRAAGGWVAAHAVADEPIICPGTAQTLRYYYKGPATVLDHFNEPILWTKENVRAYLARKLAGAETCQIVLARSWFADPRGHFPVVLREDGEILDEATVTGVRMYRWRAGPGLDAPPNAD